jgi:hypothetical protein
MDQWSETGFVGVDLFGYPRPENLSACKNRPTKRFIALARVSSKEQQKEGRSLKTQVKALERKERESNPQGVAARPASNRGPLPIG